MTMTMPTVTAIPKATNVRFRVDGRPTTAGELVDLIGSRPRRFAKLVISKQVSIHAEPSVLDALQGGPLGEFVDDDGTMTASASMAALAGAFLVGFAIGVVGGVAIGVAISDSSGDTETEELRRKWRKRTKWRLR